MDFRIFTEPQQGASYEQLLTVALESERLGFDAFFRSDHYLAMGGGAGLPGPTDAWITLAGLARDTSTIRLGTMVTAGTFRYPGPLAISVAQVDEMSGGRVELGLGTAWFAEEHAAYGIPFPELGERFERLEEQLAVITGLWDTPVGERFSYPGKYYQLTDSPALPKPTQRPHPPIIVGGGGPKRTPRLAATYADEFNMAFRPVELIGEQYARVREACERVGRDPGSMIYSTCRTLCVGESEAEVQRRIANIGGDPERLHQSGLAGTVEQVLEQAGKLAELGTQRCYLQIMDLADLDHIRLVAERLVPAFR